MDRINDIELINGDVAIIFDNDEFKALKSNKYNFLFNKKDGFFVRWGKGEYTNLVKGFSITELSIYRVWCDIWGEKFNFYEFITDLSTDGDEMISIPEIVDIEITTKPCSNICSFCYKKNIGVGNNMVLETFKKIIDKIPFVTQIAFGITDIDANPDMWDIFNYTRKMGIVPNVTINCKKMNSDIYDKLSNTMGAVACSYYDEDECFNSVYELTRRGMKQVNIHHMIHSENFDETLELLNKTKTDSRLKNLNAVVLLSLKKVGLAENKYDILSQEKFKELTIYALENNIKIGYDSCGSIKFLNSIKSISKYDNLSIYVDKCESSVYSMYINTDGYFSPCSFVNFKNKISVTECNNFFEDIWYNDDIVKFRNKVIYSRNNNISCSVYRI